MFRLMNLELTRIKENKFKGILLEIIIISIVLVLLIVTTVHAGDIVGMLDNANDADKAEIVQDMEELASMYTGDELILTIVALPFLIYAAVNFSRFVVKDYENGWTQELFAYPISRKKMLGSKILLGYLVSSVGMLLSSLLIYGALSLLHIAQFSLPAMIQILSGSILTPLIALIAMALGANRKSGIVTVVAATAMTVLLQSNTGTFSLQNFPLVNYSLALLGIVLTCVMLLRANRYDFVN